MPGKAPVRAWTGPDIAEGCKQKPPGLVGACFCAFFVEAALVQWTRTGSREGRMPNEKE